MDIMTALFDEDEVARRYYLRVSKELLQQGIQKGLQKGRQERDLQTANRLFARGSSEEDVADILGLSLAEVKQMKANMPL